MCLPKPVALLFGLLFMATSSPAFAVCGDGSLDADEGCDDGDTNSDDGCGYACYVEEGYQCPGAGDCDPICDCLVLLRDDFDDNLPSFSKWKFLTSFHPNASVVEGGQQLTLSNGSWVAADLQLEPIDKGALSIRATWHIGAGDLVTVTTRSNLAQGADGYPQSWGGRFTVSEADDTVTIAVPGGASGVVGLAIAPGDEIWLEIMDDGHDLSLRVTNWPAGGMPVGGGPAPSVALTAVSTGRYADNFVVFANRPADGEADYASSLDDVFITSRNAFACQSITCPSALDICETEIYALATSCDDFDDATGGDVCDGLGTCRGVLLSCGNGSLDPGEECDDGTDNSNSEANACRTDCRDAYCGDNVLDLGEQCDHGLGNSNTVADACRLNCRTDRCGDGATDSDEVCDDGNTRNNDGCNYNCTQIAPGWYCDLIPCYTLCGDELIAGTEVCDDGAANSDTLPDACRNDCLAARCGDGAIDTGEACDNGSGNSDTLPDACRAHCELPTCGDGVVDSNELCDDGNQMSGDGCNGVCAVLESGWDCRSGSCVSICGDALMVGDEECDDGADNGSLPDGCRNDCRAARCGDGIKDTAEACDDGNRENNDGCVNGCVAPTCGDGYLFDIVEQCDDGADNSDSEPDACRTDCARPSCGDGVLDYDEECDDGNRASKDGCTSFCAIEEIVTPGTGGGGGSDGTDGVGGGGCAAGGSGNPGPTPLLLLALLAGFGRRQRAGR